ncbi:MAG: lytic transglycosylase domain-containing protein [Treponema sp.]|jgi:soluble lytic murein transglycosylase|nr:lytic transglycosylase domain-containing protein [Treponema sp.]
MAQVLGISGQEAAKRLEQGDVGFILDAEFPAGISAALSALKPLSGVHPNAAFFAALLVEAAEAKGLPGSQGKKNILFALALEGSPLSMREAAEKLIVPVLENEELATEVLKLLGNRNNDALVSLRTACLYRLNRFAEAVRASESQKDKSSWNKAFYLLSLWQETKKTEPGSEKFLALHDEALAFFLTAPVDSAWQWALREFTKDEITNGEFIVSELGLFSPAERAVFSGRAATARSQFTQSLAFFNNALAGDIQPFLQYPELFRDLGRTIQFAAANARKEGIELLSSWEEQIHTCAIAAHPDLEYLLHYFLGRIYRQDGQRGRSTAAFQEALEIAPDLLQADACIWYMLTNTLDERAGAAAALFKTYIPRMFSLPYFDDVLERLSRFLTSQKDWRTMEEIFTLLLAKNANADSVAQYAWILGRAAEENYFYPANREDFFQIAFERGNTSLYYRAMSAWKLGIALVPEISQSSGSGRNSSVSAEMEFLLGFFNFNAADLALPYIQKYENSLTIPELRTLGTALANSDIINESLNFVSRYMARDEFIMTREDLLLFFPQPFKDLIERYAKEASLAPELLFGLIRTESYFKADAVSRVGAVGLGQLMPDTAMDMANRIARRTGIDYRPGGIDLIDPEVNVHISSYYLNYLIDYTGSPMTALIAYNGGMGRVRSWRAAEPRLPEDLFLETIEFVETREYGRRVLAAAAIYGYLYYDMSMEEVIADIYR